MIKKITVTNHVGDTVVLELMEPETSGFIITNIEGLGPAESTINMSSISTNDGSMFNSSKLETRNIVLTIKFMEEEILGSIEKTRLKTYKYFPIKQRIHLLIETDNRTVDTYGYVESNTPDIFSKDEGCQISIICPDPYFYSAGPNGMQNTIFKGVYPLFEFPFSNNHATDKLIEVGNLLVKQGQFIHYQGDAEVGMTLKIVARGIVEGLVIYNETTNERMGISDSKLLALTGSGIVNGDVITINTVKGDKYINLLRQGKNYNILNCLDKKSQWMRLVRGDNAFVYSVTHGANNLDFSIQNRIVYEGV